MLAESVYLRLHIFLDGQAKSALSEGSIQGLVTTNILTGQIISWEEGYGSSERVLHPMKHKCHSRLLCKNTQVRVVTTTAILLMRNDVCELMYRILGLLCAHIGAKYYRVGWNSCACLC